MKKINQNTLLKYFNVSLFYKKVLIIKGIKDAHRTDYRPKVQLLQTKDDTENGDIVNFKQVRYTAEKD
ncbi:hypothetical protein ACIGHG_18180 [Bacillus sp. NPDC077411]|uniref:Uncharacterized protein n=1 Tax=Bacillus bruguierae TaxID=3127667 RepID=A0ABU8FP28_9BACI